MGSENKLTYELFELIIGTILFATIITGIILISNPDSVKSQFETIEIATISSLIPKKSIITIELDQESNLKQIEDEQYLIDVNGKSIEILKKEFPEYIKLNQEKKTLSIIS